MVKRLLTFLALFALPPQYARAGAAPDPKAAASFHEMDGLAQGTSYHIVYRGKEIAAAAASVRGRLEEIDRIYSNYRPDSEISRFNQSSSKDWFPVSRELVSLVAYAQALSAATQGAFDITVGPLMKVWGFGPFKRTLSQLPTDAAVAAAKKQVGYRFLKTRREPPALRKEIPPLYVDLSGIAQGYSVDSLGETLDKLGIENYMIELGGEVKTRGDKGGNEEWLISVSSPSAEPTAKPTLVKMRNQGMTTAGDYEEYFNHEGKRLSHTLDPRTGRPVSHGLASVTVLAPTALEADAWDTALMVLGPKEAQTFIDRRRMATYLIVHDGTGFRGTQSPAFAAQCSHD